MPFFSTYLFIFAQCALIFYLFNNLLDLQMDVRDMSAFQTDSFDAVVDKGALFLRSRLRTYLKLCFCEINADFASCYDFFFQEL